MAVAVLPRYCVSCGSAIRPQDPYGVTPDVSGVGADLIECLSCARDDDTPTCETCGEPIEAGEGVYHGDLEYGCLPTVAFCSTCDVKLTSAELGEVKCDTCADDLDEEDD